MSNDTNSTPMNTPTTAEVKEMYCIQDLIHEDGTLSFSKGKSYPIVEASKLDGVKFLNNQFEEHWMQESLHEYFIDKKILEDYHQSQPKKTEVSDGWISVKDRLPEATGNYLVWCDGSMMEDVGDIGVSAPFTFYSQNGKFREDVTHWQPLLKAPSLNQNNPL